MNIAPFHPNACVFASHWLSPASAPCHPNLRVPLLSRCAPYRNGVKSLGACSIWFQQRCERRRCFVCDCCCIQHSLASRARSWLLCATEEEKDTPRRRKEEAQSSPVVRCGCRPGTGRLDGRTPQSGQRRKPWSVARKQWFISHTQQPEQHKPRKRSLAGPSRTAHDPNASPERACNVHVPAQGKPVER